MYQHQLSAERVKMPPEAKIGPLTETVYYVLLALHAPLHGYGVMQFVDEITDGRVRLGPGTLYGALTALLEKGWITPIAGAKGDRKKEYVITDAGRRTMCDELERLEELLRNGRRTMKGEPR
jgi:DNA-binding PadR family transcriptional regulator